MDEGRDWLFQWCGMGKSGYGEGCPSFRDDWSKEESLRAFEGVMIAGCVEEDCELGWVWGDDWTGGILNGRYGNGFWDDMTRFEQGVGKERECYTHFRAVAGRRSGV